VSEPDAEEILEAALAEEAEEEIKPEIKKTEQLSSKK